jgi:hypothetical protein
MSFAWSVSLIRVAILLAAMLTVGRPASGQDTPPGPASAAAAPSAPLGPAAALRDALVAACAHNEKDFGNFFTAANRDAFSRMTPAARVSLMKRFVLLDGIGTPSSMANPSGRPIVRCQTSIGAAEIQIGGTDLRENLAFLPIELRDATDSEATAIHVKIGMIREAGQWKILSLGLLLLDIPSLEAEWDEAEISPNEESALQTLKALAEAIENYRKTFTKLPESLAELGPPLHGAPNLQAANLVDSDMANGMKNGYTFRYVLTTVSTSGAPARYELAAMPSNYGRGGRRSFFRDADGKFHAADHQGAVGSSSDPLVE